MYLWEAQQFRQPIADVDARKSSAISPLLLVRTSAAIPFDSNIHIVCYHDMSASGRIAHRQYGLSGSTFSAVNPWETFRSVAYSWMPERFAHVQVSLADSSNHAVVERRKTPAEGPSSVSLCSLPLTLCPPSTVCTHVRSEGCALLSAPV